jgi:hypothetical protein
VPERQSQRPDYNVFLGTDVNQGSANESCMLKLYAGDTWGGLVSDGAVHLVPHDTPRRTSPFQLLLIGTAEQQSLSFLVDRFVTESRPIPQCLGLHDIRSRSPTACGLTAHKANPRAECFACTAVREMRRLYFQVRNVCIPVSIYWNLRPKLLFKSKEVTTIPTPSIRGVEGHFILTSSAIQ